MKKLAEEIIRGRRLSQQDDLSVFEYAKLGELAEGADRIRESPVSYTHLDVYKRQPMWYPWKASVRASVIIVS